jgi:toxin CptA
MSIAVSVVVRPSVGLRVLHAGLCWCVMISGAACPGVLAPLLCVVAGLFGWVVGRPCGIALQLDISGVGQVRLAVYQESGTIRRLLEGSTLWPGMLLLRLAGDDGGVRSVLVLPDGVTWRELRALSLACRAIAGRTEIKTPTL